MMIMMAISISACNDGMTFVRKRQMAPETFKAMVIEALPKPLMNTT